MSRINGYNISTTDEGNLMVDLGADGTMVYNNGDMAWILVATCLVFIMSVSNLLSLASIKGKD